jgi:hypothetical protein
MLSHPAGTGVEINNDRFLTRKVPAMPQPESAPEAAVDRLRREIENDRKRLAFALKLAEDAELREGTSVGRLYRVIEAMGQAQ